MILETTSSSQNPLVYVLFQNDMKIFFGMGKEVYNNPLTVC